MKTEKNILIAFLLNLSFSVFEFMGGIFTGSVAIVSDAIHDIGDAASIGVSYFLEKKSKKQIQPCTLFVPVNALTGFVMIGKEGKRLSISHICQYYHSILLISLTIIA